jgi:hypothetical protein
MAGTGRIDGDDTTRWNNYDDASHEPDSAASICVETGAGADSATISEHPGAVAGAGITESGDGVHAEVALLKGRDARTGVGVEVMSASAQIGAQNEVSLALARLTGSNAPGSATGSIDVLTARLAAGTRNVDGSRGLNAGATAIGVGIEGTLQGAGWSGTAGASLGLGAEASIGLRDADGDGHAEVCARAVFAWWTLGGCAELPFESRALIPDSNEGSKP